MPYPFKNPGLFNGARDAKVHLEAFIDLACPFSKKAFATLQALVKELGVENVSVSYILQAQPWHFQSCIVDMSVVAANTLKPEFVFDYIAEVYAHFDDYVDDAVGNKGRDDILGEFAVLATKTLGVDAQPFIAKCKDSDTVLQFKFMTRYARQNSVHVTPTIFVNGLAASEPSSSWTIDQWKEFFTSQKLL